MKRIYRTAEPCAFKAFNLLQALMLVRDTDYQKFCEELVRLNEAIVAAFVVSNGIRGSHIKLEVPALKEDDARKLAEQTNTVMDIIRSNERLFGRLGYVLVHHEAVDGMFFAINSSSTVLVGLIRPYDQDKIEEVVEAEIRRSLTESVDSI